MVAAGSMFVAVGLSHSAAGGDLGRVEQTMYTFEPNLLKILL